RYPGLGRAEPVHLPRRARRVRPGAAHQLGERVRRPRLDPDHRTGRHPRPVVPAPVRLPPAGPELGERGGPGPVRRRAPVLVGPRIGRVPRGRGARVDQGPGVPRLGWHTTMVGGQDDDTVADGDRPQAPMWDQPGVHEVYRRWHRVLADYDGDRALVAEAWTETPEALARYVRPDEMHQAFNFDFLCT